MSLHAKVAKKLARERQRIIDELLPDRCTIYPVASTTVTFTPEGHYSQDAQVARSYNGSTSIPCRADMARAFRPDRLEEQIMTTLEFGLELPFDMVVEPDDEIVLNGDRYKIRRLKAQSLFDFTIEALIFHLSFPLNDD